MDSRFCEVEGVTAVKADSVGRDTVRSASLEFLEASASLLALLHDHKTFRGRERKPGSAMSSSDLHRWSDDKRSCTRLTGDQCCASHCLVIDLHDSVTFRHD